MSTTTQKVVKKTEWVSKPIDRSKRVAYGGNVEEKNIVAGTRTRSNVNYKEIGDKNTELEAMPLREKPSKSNNLLEKRNEVEFRMSKLNIKSAPNTSTRTKKKLTIKPTQQEKENAMEEEQEQEQEQEEEEEEEKQAPKKDLSSKVIKQLERLGFTYQPLKNRERYHQNKYFLPEPINNFTNTTKQVKYFESKHTVGPFSFSLFALPKEDLEAITFTKENPDYVFIGEVFKEDEEQYLLCKQHPEDELFDHSDFKVYICDDKQVKELKLSEFLATLKESDFVPDEDEE
ncbi:hypothetical protein AKO1_014698 [Acrasis kona]|uniref:Uncharacterized protein n=1 Tax=Acrasis kona TaxID=1008807 RepID=A0AAW2Z0Q5_9EUKA